MAGACVLFRSDLFLQVTSALAFVTEDIQHRKQPLRHQPVILTHPTARYTETNLVSRSYRHDAWDCNTSLDVCGMSTFVSWVMVSFSSSKTV